MMTDSKTIIGLTGNIATGKSVVRRMLENSGALGIDADIITHRTLYAGGPAYQPVLDAFGNGILGSDGEIDRRELGQIVFNHPKKLQLLESIIHPAVSESIKKRIQKTTSPIIVIEAIKLLESSLAPLCDTLWVSHASYDHQLERLLQTRGMGTEVAWQRIKSQPPQREKLKAANLVINTEGTFENTWDQLCKALNDTIQDNKNFNLMPLNINDWQICTAQNMPKTTLAHFWNMHLEPATMPLFEVLAFHMIVPLLANSVLSAMLIWDSWSYTGPIKMTLPQKLSPEEIPAILDAFHHSAHRHQCELLVLTEKQKGLLKASQDMLSFKKRTARQLKYPAWRQALHRIDSDPDTSFWTKILMQPLESDITFT